MLLRRVAELSLGREARERGVDLFKTLSAYNLGLWFDGRVAKLALSLDPPAVALVSVDGEAAIYSAEPADAGELEERLLGSLGLLEDAGEFLEIASRDPLLAPFAREWSGWRLRSTRLWWALVVAVCQQNASFRQGWSMVARLVRLYGREVALEGEGSATLPPTPLDVLREPQKLRDAGLGYRADAVLRAARAITEGTLPGESALAGAGYGEAEGALRRVKGVGSYTARLALALGLRRYDRPPIDRWVRALAARAYGVREVEVEEEWVGRWGRWSALAVVALTVALDAAPLRSALARLEAGRLLPEPGALSPATLWRYTGP